MIGGDVQIIIGDALEQLATLEAGSVNCCVTSPPYYGLRDYQVDGQMGNEATPEEYVAKMVEVFREVKRVLRDDGTLWLNLGDSYGGSWGNYGGQNRGKGTQRTIKTGSSVPNPAYDGLERTKPATAGQASKQLMGIPWRVAFALQADGWILRQDIVWAKPNPMPESVRDRCTKSHEYIFLFAKQQRYYYDQEAIKVPLKDSSVARLIQDIEQQQGSARVPGKTNGTMKAVRFGGNKQCPDTRLQSGKVWNPKQAGGGTGVTGHSGYFDASGKPLCGSKANKKSVWTVTTRGYKGAHFATFPPALIEPCILAGCPENGTVLDPFGGSGTTGQVAKSLFRNAILIELNPSYRPLIEKRLTA